MKRVKKVLLLNAFIFFLTFSLSGIDFGGSVDNLTGVTLEEGARLIQMDKVFLWIDSDLGENLSLSARGSWVYSIRKWRLPGPDLFELKGIFPLGKNSRPALSFSAGRIFVNDFTSNVLAHPVDGLKIGLGFPLLNASVFCGYTGLIFTDATRIIMSRMDYAEKIDGLKLLGPPRLIASGEIQFVELLLRQDLFLSFLMQVDLRPAAEVTNDIAGGKLHTQYSGAGLSGPIFPPLYWAGYCYLGTGKILSLIDGRYEPDTPVLSILAGGSLRMFIEKALYSSISLKALYASGDSDNSVYYEGNTAGRSTLFIPVSRPVQNLIYTPQFGNIILTELSYSLKPLSFVRKRFGDSFQVLLKGMVFLRPTMGAISEPYNTASESPYLGTEVDGFINFRIFSDLGAALSAGVFFPSTGPEHVFLEVHRSTTFLGRVEISCSF